MKALPSILGLPFTFCLLTAQTPSRINNKCEHRRENCIIELEMDSVGPFAVLYAFNVYKYEFNDSSLPGGLGASTVANGSSLTMMFVSYSSHCRFAGDHTFRFFSDSQPLQLDAETRYGPCAKSKDYAKEYVALIMPLADFKHLLAARTLAAQVGGLKFQFRPMELDQLRELADSIHSLTGS